MTYADPISSTVKAFDSLPSADILLILCTNFIKRGLHCAIYSTFTPHFMCWIYFDENVMDKNLLHISLTKFNKLKESMSF